MESVFAKLFSGLHGGFQNVPDAVVDMLNLKIAGKVAIQWVSSQTILIFSQDGRDAFLGEDVFSFLGGAVTLRYIFPDLGNDVLFGLRWDVLLWIAPCVDAEAQCLQVLENLYGFLAPTGPLGLSCSNAL